MKGSCDNFLRWEVFLKLVETQIGQQVAGRTREHARFSKHTRTATTRSTSLIHSRDECRFISALDTKARFPLFLLLARKRGDDWLVSVVSSLDLTPGSICRQIYWKSKETGHRILAQRNYVRTEFNSVCHADELDSQPVSSMRRSDGMEHITSTFSFVFRELKCKNKKNYIRPVHNTIVYLCTWIKHSGCFCRKPSENNVPTIYSDVQPHFYKGVHVFLASRERVDLKFDFAGETQSSRTDFATDGLNPRKCSPYLSFHERFFVVC